jgi:hypothetical protein
MSGVQGIGNELNKVRVKCLVFRVSENRTKKGLLL